MPSEPAARRAPWKTRKLRFDGGPPADPPPGPENGNLLELFRACLRRTIREQRKTVRHDAGGFAVWIGWRKGGREFIALTGRLVNISRGGAFLNVTQPPEELREVWVCLDPPDSADCVTGTALEVAPIRRGEWSVRVEFTDPCPHPFFEAALLGLTATGAKPDGP